MKKTLKKLIIGIGIIVGIPILLFVLFVAFLVALHIFTPNPPKPEITYAEFPFEVVYEIDGEIITVTDVYVCEFDGFSISKASSVKQREWNGYIKSTGEEYLILLEDGNLTFACSLGGPKYYMSDPSMPTYENTPTIFYIISPDETGGTTSGVGDIEPLLEQYKIKLISWKLADPIQNSFE